MGSEMDMSDLLGVYLEEAEEQIQCLDRGILLLEQNPDDIDIIKEIFRAAHTLKGSSAMLGFTHIADLTHAMENLLDLLRAEKLQANSEIVDLLLNGIDNLRTLILQISNGEAFDLDTGPLCEALKNVYRGEASAQISASEPTNEDSGAYDGPEGSYKIRAKVDDECLMPSVRVFMLYNALEGLGEIFQAEPDQENLDNVSPGEIISFCIMPSEGIDAVNEALSRLTEISILSCIAAGENADVSKAGIEDDSEHSTTAQPDTTATAATGVRTPKTSAAEGPKAIQTVRVGVDRLDRLMNLVAELVIHRTRISQIESEISAKYEKEESVQGLAESAAHIGRVVNELQEHIMQVRLLPVEQVFNRFPRMVRDLAHKVGKEIDFVMEGQETELDRSILEGIVDPLTHLLRNSIDHASETPDEREKLGKPRKARVLLAARQQENRIIIEVNDDGRGIDIEKVKQAALKKGATTQEQLDKFSDYDALQLVFASGVSTAEKVTDVSGRGVGMDVVRSNIQAMSGSVSVETKMGEGTSFIISLPLTLAIIQALVTSVADKIYVIPLNAVAETFRCESADICRLNHRPAINFRGSVLPLVNLGSLFDPNIPSDKYDEETSTFVVVKCGSFRVGLVVDKLIGEQEVVIKSLGAFFGDLKGIAGATILGDGRVALILDVQGLGRLLGRRRFKRPEMEVAA